jgi:hypothetical protein
MEADMTHVESDDDLNLGQDDGPVIEPTFEQQLSRMNLRQLQIEAKDRGLSGAGSTADLIARINTYEETGGVIPDPAAQAGTALKSGIAPAPVEPTPAPAPMQPAVGEVKSASAPAAGSAQPKSRQRTGFFPDMNVYRAETPIGGPLGSTEPPDDNAHMRLIEEAHQIARKAGYHTRGYPNAGKRIGFASINVPGQGRMRTVIYEVFAREEE